MLPEGNHNNNTGIKTSNPISIGGGVISSNSVSIDSTKLERIHRAQSEKKMGVMELTRIVAGICSTQQSMIATISDLTILLVKELRDSANN